MKIMPALLDTDPEDMSAELARLTPFFKSFQIDVMDGIFVPDETVQLEEIKSVVEEYPDIIIDFHLMVEDWNHELDILETFYDSNIRYVLIHAKTNPPADVFTEQLSDQYRLGLVVNPEEEIKTIVQKYDLSHIPAIQIMTVVPGKQGQPFISESLNKIEQLRDVGYKSDIIIDGAVNAKTLPVILGKKYVPDYAGAGSFLTRAKNLDEAISSLDTTAGVSRA